MKKAMWSLRRNYGGPVPAAATAATVSACKRGILALKEEQKERDTHRGVVL
jgi:hypothetical protein